MAPNPARLRAAADGLRTTARRLDLDLGPLAEKGDHQTWEGPAATSYRRAAADVEGRGTRVTAGLRRLADDLETRAGAVQRAAAEADAARRERLGFWRQDGPAPDARRRRPPSLDIGAAITEPTGRDHG